MPRYFNSLAEAEAGIKGYRGRNAFVADQRAARQAHLNSPETKARAEHMRHANEDHALRGVIVAAEDHLAMLRGKLATCKRQAEFMASNAYRTGDISADAAKVRRQLDGLPDLIARAEQEVADARAALVAHRASAAGPAQAVVEPQPEPAEVEAKRAPGRPRKAA